MSYQVLELRKVGTTRESKNILERVDNSVYLVIIVSQF
jgi:hypothetical protein